LDGLEESDSLRTLAAELAESVEKL
jgi:hypothetical protein